MLQSKAEKEKAEEAQKDSGYTSNQAGVSYTVHKTQKLKKSYFLLHQSEFFLFHSLYYNCFPVSDITFFAIFAISDHFLAHVSQFFPKMKSFRMPIIYGVLAFRSPKQANFELIPTQITI